MKFGLKDKDMLKIQNHIIRDYIVEEEGVVIPIIIKKCLIERSEDTLENYQKKEISVVNYMIFGGSCVKQSNFHFKTEL